MSSRKMSNVELLIQDRPKQLRYALDQFSQTEETANQFIEIIKTWLETQHHLPETLSDNFIRNWLICNKFSIENTKKCIDMYYTVRSLIPELFGKSNPKLANMQRIAKILYILPLPYLTEDGSRVTIYKLQNDNPDMFDFYDFLAYFLNILEIRFQEDILTAHIAIFDMDNVKIGHVIKITMIHLKHAVTIFEKVFRSRVKKAVILNCAPYAVKAVNAFKYLLKDKEKMASKFEIIAGIDSLKDFVPISLLPKEYGGSTMSLVELHELWQKKLADYQDRFDTLDTLRPNESLRLTPLVNDELLGFHGNFRQLSLD